MIEIVIPDNITTIGTRCFSECSNLVEITIPKSVVSISSDYVFYGTTNLLIYNLYWDSNIIRYNGGSRGFPTKEGTIFTIPQGTTQAYIDAGYPSDKLVERTE